MSDKWRGLHGPITAQDAEAEPIDQCLFGPSYEARQRQRSARQQQSGINKASYAPWKKPTIVRPKT